MEIKIEPTLTKFINLKPLDVFELTTEPGELYVRLPHLMCKVRTYHSPTHFDEVRGDFNCWK